MKKFFFAAAVLLMSLAGCRGGQVATTEETPFGNDMTAVAPQTQGGLKIAYINIDSLIMGYNMALDLRNAFESKYKKAERQLQVKAQGLEKEVLDYQDKASKGLMTRQQMADREETLQKQQQAFMAEREKHMAELDEEDKVMNNRVFYAVSDYLKEFNSNYKYSMIISTTASGPLLNADPSLNITKEVLQALNEKYASEKGSSRK